MGDKWFLIFQHQTGPRLANSPKGQMRMGAGMILKFGMRVKDRRMQMAGWGWSSDIGQHGTNFGNQVHTQLAPHVL